MSRKTFDIRLLATPYILKTLLNFVKCSNHAGGEKFFSEGPVTEAVPRMFMCLGLIYTCMFTIGIILVRNPDYSEIREELDEQTREEVIEGQAKDDLSLIMPINDQGEPDVQNHRNLEGVPVKDVTPGELIRIPRAWHLSGCLSLTALTGLIVIGVYKRFGQMYFSNDHFLSLVGSSASLGNAIGRVFWGHQSDIWGPYRTLYCVAGTMVTLVATWSLTTGSETLFALWVTATVFCHGGYFAIFPTTTAMLFGKDHVGPNFGLIFLNYGLFSLAGIIIIPRLHVDFESLTFILAGISASSLLAVYTLNNCYSNRPPRR